MGGCNWNSELTQYLPNTCQIHCIYAIYGCKSYFLKKLYPLRNGRPQLLLWNKETLYTKKNFFLRLNAVTFKEIFFRNNYFKSQPFFMSYYFTRIFVHLPVIVGVCYFNVHKLIAWDQENIYLFKFNSRNTRKRYEICPKLTLNTTESLFDVFTVKCFYCWLWIGKCLSRNSFLCKYYSQKLNFLKTQPSVHIQLIFMKRFSSHLAQTENVVN